MRIMQKYSKVFTLSFSHALKNTKSLIGLSFFLLICLVIFSNLWKVMAAKTGAFHLEPTTLLWYIALNEWIFIAIPRPERDMEMDLRSGKLAYLLPRPISYLISTFFHSFGAFMANFLVLGVVSFGFTWMQVGFPPIPAIAWPLFLAIGALSGIVGILFQMVIGLSAFWIHEVEPFTWIWEKLLFAFGGLILPLSIYPQWWQKLSLFTPFPYILGYRSALVIEFGFLEFFRITSGLLFFGLFCIGAISLLYKKGLKILNIEGG